MNIYVARHGQTDWNKKGILLGSTNMGLNETGKKQAEELKEKLEHVEFDYVISSDLKRALETTKIVTNNIPIIENSKLRERNYGILEGTSPQNISKFWDVSTNLQESSVEPIKDFLNRIFIELDMIIEKYASSNNILIITHYGVIMAIAAYFSNKFDYCFDNFKLDNCDYKKYIYEELKDENSILQ